MNKSISTLIIQFEEEENKICPDRKIQIKAIAEVLKTQDSSKLYQFIFVCTHNSRRSVFGQVWAKVLADYYDIPLQSYSGGTEVTAVNDNAINCLTQLGFDVNKLDRSNNPKTEVRYGNSNTLYCFSKLYDNAQNPADNFYAFMLCEHAAENCPVIPNASKRFNLTYPDPKRFDGTTQQDSKYKEVALTIGRELSFLIRRL